MGAGNCGERRMSAEVGYLGRKLEVAEWRRREDSDCLEAIMRACVGGDVCAGRCRWVGHSCGAGICLGRNTVVRPDNEPWSARQNILALSTSSPHTILDPSHSAVIAIRHFAIQ